MRKHVKKSLLLIIALTIALALSLGFIACEWAITHQEDTRNHHEVITPDSVTNAIHFLGFGWADAFILQSVNEHGDTILGIVDAGLPGSHYYIADYARRILGIGATEHFYFEFGISTHPHPDHNGGFTGGQWGADYSFTSGLFSDPLITFRQFYFREHARDVNFWYTELVAQIARYQIPHMNNNAELQGHSFTFGDMRITLMFDNDRLTADGVAPGTHLNPESMAQLVEVNGQRILLTGDLCTATGDFVKEGIRAATDDSTYWLNVLNLGHHGIHGTGVDGVLRYLNPTTMVTNNNGAELNTPRRQDAARANALRQVRTQTPYARLFSMVDSGGIVLAIDADGYRVGAIGEIPRFSPGETFTTTERVLTNWTGVPIEG